MQPAKINYKVIQGSTFEEVLRWESALKTYNPISMVSKSAPCVITTTNPLTLPVGWRFRVTGAGGMKEINTVDLDYTATAVAGNTVEINQVNSLGFGTYTSGGVVEYNEPVDLSEYSARMHIRSAVNSADILYDASQNITLDNTKKTITISIPASSTQQFAFNTAVYSLELFTQAGYVVTLIKGNMTLAQEVTR